MSSCPDGYYTDNSLNRCLDCHYPCKTCSASNTNCTSCSRGILHNNQCVNDCPLTYYANYLQNQNVTCQACQPNCINCQSLTSCISCTNSTYLYEGSCGSTCPSGFYADSTNNSCSACIPPCKTCSSNSSCLTCTSGYLDNNACTLSCNSSSYINSEFKCTPCVLPCLSCYSETTCLSCSLPHLLFNQSCITLAQCNAKSGYYPNYSPNATSATSG